MSNTIRVVALDGGEPNLREISSLNRSVAAQQRGDRPCSFKSKKTRRGFSRRSERKRRLAFHLDRDAHAFRHRCSLDVAESALRRPLRDVARGARADGLVFRVIGGTGGRRRRRRHGGGGGRGFGVKPHQAPRQRAHQGMLGIAL